MKRANRLNSFKKPLPPIGRRNFLRGLGACIALPALHSMTPSGLFAEEAALQLATTKTGAPLRTAFVMFPNGAIQPNWWPSGGLKDFVLRKTLSPLENQRNNIQVLGGLDHNLANPNGDGGGDHARGNGVFLTGVKLNKSATDIRAGISIDQVIANQVGSMTRFPSLELSCDPTRRSANCDSGYSCAYQYNISWKSASTPMTPESNPRLAFERMFGEGTHGTRTANVQQRMMNRRSVLDFVINDTQALMKDLAYDDKEKFDQYLTGVRDVEARIQKAEQHGPTTDPAQETPSGIPENHTEYLNLMYDMMLLAFKTDSTRVATFLVGHDGDNRSHPHIGISEGHHDISHHQNRADRMDKVAKIDKFYVERFAAFLDRLDNEYDLDGNSILHNSRIVYGCSNADSNDHTHENLPVLLAGAGGGKLDTGRYVNHGSAPMSNLYMTLAEQAGLTNLSSFGDSTGFLKNV